MCVECCIIQAKLRGVVDPNTPKLIVRKKVAEPRPGSQEGVDRHVCQR